MSDAVPAISVRPIAAAASSVQRDYRRHVRYSGWARNAAIFFGSLILLVYVLAPVTWLVSSSLQTEKEIVSIPPHWIPEEPTTRNFRAIFSAGDDTVTYETRKKVDASSGGYIPPTAAHLLPAMWNSFLVATIVVILNLLVGTPAAYAISKIRFWGRRASIFVVLLTRVVPDIALVVPFFLVVRKLGLLDNIWSLVATYLAITVPFTVFILLQYFDGLPDDLDKAARVDGCSRFQTLTKVFLPLALPSLVAVVLFTFLTCWNEFLFALMFTQTVKSQTVPILVASFTSDFTVSFSFINAAGVVAIVPPVIVAVVFERYIVSGLTAGAVKG
jgi:multiple sugar transport system permease protein